MYKLLIVEDEAFIRKGLTDGIPWKEYGFSVSGEAANGQEALDIIGRRAPDVVLTDIRMPVMNGISLMQKLRTENPDIKIVILSGYDEFEYAQKGISFGASAYILKPTKDDQISDIFRKIKTELDDIHAKKRSIKNLQTTSKLSKRLFFTDLITGRRTQQETIKESAAQLHIAYSGSFCVTLFGGDFPAIPREAIDRAVDPALKPFPRIRVIEKWMMESPSRIVLVLSRDSKSNDELVVEPTESVRRNLETQVGSVLTAGVGGFVGDLAALTYSFEQASAALQQMFFLGKGKVYSSSRGYRAITERQEEERELFESIIKSVFSHQPLDMGPRVERYFRLLSRTRQIEETRFKILELVLQIIRKMNGLEITLKEVFRHETDIMDSIKKNDTLKQLRAWTEGFCLEAAKHLCDPRYRRKNPSVTRVTEYMQKNYAADLSVKDFARVACLSPSYFCTLFKKETGQRPGEYLMDIRLEKAKELLHHREHRIGEIAMKVGYGDFRHFGKLFKRREGMSPRSYRKRTCPDIEQW